MGVDGDEGCGAGIVLTAHTLQDFAPVQPELTAARDQPGQDEVAVAQVVRQGPINEDLVPGSPVHGIHPDLARGLADHAQYPVDGGAQPLDHPGFGLAGLGPLETDEQAIPEAGCTGCDLVRVGREPDQGGVFPLHQPDHQFTVGVPVDDLDHADRRELAGKGETPAAPAPEVAAVLEVPQHVPERDPVCALQPEGPSDVGTVGFSGLPDEGQKGRAVRQALGWAGAGSGGAVRTSGRAGSGHDSSLDRFSGFRR